MTFWLGFFTALLLMLCIHYLWNWYKSTETTIIECPAKLRLEYPYPHYHECSKEQHHRGLHISYDGHAWSKP